MTALNNLGIEIIIFIQGMGEWLRNPMQFFSYLGVTEFYIFVAPVIYWCIHPGLGLRMGLMLMVSASINSFFKFLFRAPRPYWIDDRIIAYMTETSFGIPSGHAQNAVVFWGVIAAWVKRTWMWIIAIAAIALIGFSRMYVGVHFPHDVLLGWIVGIIILVAYVFFEKPILLWLNTLNASQKILLSFIISVFLILPGYLTMLLINQWTVPEAWITISTLNAPSGEPIDPISLSKLIISAAAFFGMATGAVFLGTRGGFDAGGNFWIRAARFFVGIFGVVILYFGPGFLYPDNGSILRYILQYTHFAAIGFWVTGLAPLLFRKFGLARPIEV